MGTARWRTQGQRATPANGCLPSRCTAALCCQLGEALTQRPFHTHTHRPPPPNPPTHLPAPTCTPQVLFFSQGALPALTEDGRIIREAPARLAMAPDGNGGVYMALRASGALADMAAHGVEAVDCYCVDNALVRLGDPLFVGYCHERGIECGEAPREAA